MTTEIIIKKDFSAADEKKAALAASEFRKSKFTSDVSSLLNFIDLKRSIIPCDDHARRFNATAHHYRLHFKIKRVRGNCDVCQRYVEGRFYIHENEWIEGRKAEEKFRAACEYATIVS